MGSMVSSVDSPRSSYDLNKYVLDKIGQPDGMRMRLDHGPFSKNDLVTATGWEISAGKYCVKLKADNPVLVPISKIEKHVEDRPDFNKGITFEKQCTMNLITGDLMHTIAAGCSAAPDCTFTHENGDVLVGELKASQKCVAGQTVLHWTDDQWKIAAHTEAKYPGFSTCIQNATVDGRPLLQHVNDHVSEPTPGQVMKGVSIYSDTMSLEPVFTFMVDKNVDILHFGDKGTFGISDRLPGLPKPVGECRFRVRGKHPGSLTLQTEILFVEPSTVKFDMSSPEAVRQLKEKWFK